VVARAPLAYACWVNLSHLSRYRPGLEFALSAAGAAVMSWYVLVWGTAQGTVGFDCYAYWRVSAQHPYDVPMGVVGSFTYTPAAALAFAPVHALPFTLFFLLWTGFLAACLVWLTRRHALMWLAFVPVSLELYHANVHLLLAVVCVLGFRYPALWSIGLLTKVTPGISLLWFAVRGEWRSLAIALGSTAAIAAVSFAVAPGAWSDYVGFVQSSMTTGPIVNNAYQWLVPPLAVRLAVAAALVCWGARTDRRWVVPVAVMLAMPVLWITAPAVLTAVPRLRRPSGQIE
jgi:hypothetical protein